MKVLINKIFCLIILIISCNKMLQGQNIDNIKDDLYSLQIKGKVKTITQTWYYVKDSLGTPVKTYINAIKISTLNESSKLIEEKYYNSATPNDYKTLFAYDDKGNKLKSYTYNYKTLDTSYTNIYEYNGREIIKLSYTNKLTAKVIYKYDKKGRLIEYSTVPPNPQGYIDKYEYNKEGDIHTCRKYNLDRGDLMFKHTFKYNKSGQVIELITYDSNGTLVSKQEYKYIFDEFGNWISKTHYEKGVANSIVKRKIEYY